MRCHRHSDFGRVRKSGCEGGYRRATCRPAMSAIDNHTRIRHSRPSQCVPAVPSSRLGDLSAQQTTLVPFFRVRAPQLCQRRDLATTLAASSSVLRSRRDHDPDLEYCFHSHTAHKIAIVRCTWHESANHKVILTEQQDALWKETARCLVLARHYPLRPYPVPWAGMVTRGGRVAELWSC